MAPDGKLYGVRFDVVNPVVYEIDTAKAALTVQRHVAANIRNSKQSIL